MVAESDREGPVRQGKDGRLWGFSCCSTDTFGQLVLADPTQTGEQRLEERHPLTPSQDPGLGPSPALLLISLPENNRAFFPEVCLPWSQFPLTPSL